MEIYEVGYNIVVFFRIECETIKLKYLFIVFTSWEKEGKKTKSNFYRPIVQFFNNFLWTNEIPLKFFLKLLSYTFIHSNMDHVDYFDFVKSLKNWHSFNRSWYWIISINSIAICWESSWNQNTKHSVCILNSRRRGKKTYTPYFKMNFNRSFSTICWLNHFNGWFLEFSDSFFLLLLFSKLEIKLFIIGCGMTTSSHDI